MYCRTWPWPMPCCGSAGRLRLPAWSALLGCALVLFNPLLDSAVGLEITLSAAVMALLLMAAVEARPGLFGLFAGLLAYTRVDLVIFALVLFLGYRVLLRAWWKILLAAGAVGLPWFAWSWIVLGSAVPDTLLIKATHGVNQPPYAFVTSPLGMYRSFPAMTVLAFLPALLGIVALSAWAVVWVQSRFRTDQVNEFTPVVLLGLGGMLHAPHHAAPAAVSMVTALIAVGQVGYNVQHGIPWTQAAYNGNAATPTEYAAVGRGIRPLVGDHPVRSPGEVGTIAYFCDREVLDELSDRGIMVSLLNQQKQHDGPISRFVLDVNFYFLDKNLKSTPVDYTILYSTQKPVNGRYWPATGPSG